MLVAVYWSRLSYEPSADGVPWRDGSVIEGTRKISRRKRKRKREEGMDGGNLEEAERSLTPENTLTHCVPLHLSGLEANERAPLSSSLGKSERARTSLSVHRDSSDVTYGAYMQRRHSDSALSPDAPLAPRSFKPLRHSLSRVPTAIVDWAPEELTVLCRLD